MLNRCTMSGRLVADPQVQKTTKGISYVKFAIANEDDFPDANGTRPVQFVSAVAWRSTAEYIARNFTKGQMITIDGKLHIRRYTTNEGDKRNVTELVVEQAYFSGGGNGRKEHTASDGQEQSAEAEIESTDAGNGGDEGDFPF